MNRKFLKQWTPRLLVVATLAASGLALAQQNDSMMGDRDTYMPYGQMGYGGMGMMGGGMMEEGMTPTMKQMMGQGMMGYGYGQGMGPGMMGPGYGYAPGEAEPQARLSPEESEARAKAFVQEYIRRYLPGYSLEKKQPAKKK